MPGRDVIVVGASTGGVEALTQLVAQLPPGLPAALFLVLHIPANATSLMPQILSRHGALPADHPRDGEAVRPGRVYIAPPDFHMLLRPGQVQLVRGPRENHVRPAIDPLFRSAARSYGPRVIAVVLSGQLYDGTAGLMAVRAAGGVAVVQDPADALVDVMPRTARDIAGADHVLRLREMGPALEALVQEPIPEKGAAAMADPQERADEIVSQDKAEQEAGERNGEVSLFTCPECGGSLWQLGEDRLLQFRCHVGHAYYADSLLSEHAEQLEAALWTAVRMFKERAVLSRQMCARARAHSHDGTAERFAEQAQVAEKYGEAIRQFIGNGAASLPPRPEEPSPSPEGRPPARK